MFTKISNSSTMVAYFNDETEIPHVVFLCIN